MLNYRKRKMKEKDSNFNFFEKYFIVGWMKRFSEIMCEMYSKKIIRKIPQFKKVT